MCARFGAKGNEMRALSALDVGLWDILGQAAGLPVYQLLGGACRDRIKTYNTCAGPLYGRTLRAGYGITDAAGTLDDLVAFKTDAGELARDLLSEGITGMKIWPFDVFAQEKGGVGIEYRDLQAGLEPVRKIREAVGREMEIMIEGHGFWSLPAAVQIARALEEFEPAWVEDLIRADDPTALAALCQETSIPVLASEYLMTRWEYRRVLDVRGADIVMIDPVWCGGITEARKIATMADTYAVPVTMHDCTGPHSLFAGIHLSINAPNALYQETVRAYLRTFYAGPGHRSARDRRRPYPGADGTRSRYPTAAGRAGAPGRDCGYVRALAITSWAARFIPASSPLPGARSGRSSIRRDTPAGAGSVRRGSSRRHRRAGASGLGPLPAAATGAWRSSPSRSSRGGSP